MRAARRAGNMVIINDKDSEIPAALQTSTPRNSDGRWYIPRMDGSQTSPPDM